MKVLFCHGGPLRIDESNNYYGISYNNEMFSRYYDIAEELSVLIRVNKISMIEGEQKFSKITISPFEVIECPNIASLKGMILYNRKCKNIVYKAVKNSDFIVIRLPSLIGNLAINAAIKMNKPYLIEVVGCPWDALWNHSLKGKFVAPYMYFKTKKLVKNAKFVVYVTNEFLQKRYPTNGESINCSNVTLKQFDDKVLLNRLNKINTMKKNEKIILGTTAAVDVRYKSQEYVIKALGKLKKQGIENYEYQLVGGGDQTYLKSIAKKYNVSEQVKFIGVMPHNKVFEWLDNIDIYLQPSRVEGLPRALIEAMSRGLPAIGSNAGGIPELLESQFIFSIGRKAPDKICSILQGFNKNIMREQAKRNYFESKKYDKEIIEMRRKEFFNKFKSNVNCKVNLG